MKKKIKKWEELRIYNTLYKEYPLFIYNFENPYDHIYIYIYLKLIKQINFKRGDEKKTVTPEFSKQ